MKYFISCDWGTSALRLRLVETATGAVIAGIRSPEGIAAVNDSWKAQEKSRLDFYTAVLTNQLALLAAQTKETISSVPVIISGMASSSIGMLELPYQVIPFTINAASLATRRLEASASCSNPLVIVSGVCTGKDVMRGEETILAGCTLAENNRHQLFILPGTHSKHLTVSGKQLTDLNTYMTGEVFHILCTNSILGNSVIPSGDIPLQKDAFLNGVQESLYGVFLNNIFHVRAKQLFGLVNKENNHHYLSGLVIGEELKALLQQDFASITIVSSGRLLQLYAAALSILNLPATIHTQDADEALIRGQALIMQYYQ